MANVLHSQVALGSRHSLQNLEYADEAARLAATGLTSDNLYQIARQQDDDSLWMLVEVSPEIWAQLWTSTTAEIDADDASFKVSVDNTSVLSMKKGGGAPNLIFGYEGNNITNIPLVIGNSVLGGGELGATNRIDGAATCHATIAGGKNNYIQGTASTNPNDATNSFIGAGVSNTVQTISAFIGGGSSNLCANGADASAICGGSLNSVTAAFGFIGAGSGNSINSGGNYSVIPGGQANTISGPNSIAAGQANSVTSAWSTAFGTDHIVSGDYGTALGRECTAGGLQSFAAGYNCEANSTDSFALGENAISAAVNSFCISDGASVANNNSRTWRSYFTNGHSFEGGNVAIKTTTATDPLDVNGDTMRLRTPKTPASASDTGNQGSIAWDSDYIYICVATDAWKRVGISTW